MDKKIIKALDELFEKTPPHQLRQLINGLYFDYIARNFDNLPANIQDMTEDLHFLNQFLEIADRMRSKT
jgi:hypothetical protein